MWLIPGKTKVKMEIFKGISLADVIIGVITFALLVCLFISNFSTLAKIILLGVTLFIAALLLVRVDSEPNYVMILHIIHYFAFPRRFVRRYDDTFYVKKNEVGERQAATDEFFEDKKEEEGKKKKNANANWTYMDDIIGYTDIKEDFIVYDNQYYGGVIEISPVEFRFFSEHRRNNSIVNGLGRILRGIHMEYSANIVKIERPIHYEVYWQKEHDKVDELRAAFEAAMISEEEFKARVEVVFDRIHEIESYMNENKVVVPHFYLVLYDSDRNQLRNSLNAALADLASAELPARRLNDKEIAVFLKYSNALDFNENEIDQIAPEDYAAWSMPNELQFKMRTITVNQVITHNMRVSQFPMLVNDAWLATQMSVPSTKVVIKCRPMDRQKSIRNIDRSLNELRVQYAGTSTESKHLELQSHIESLSSLLVTLQDDSEALLEVNIYVTAYDLMLSEANKFLVPPANSSLVRISNMKRTVRRYYAEARFRLNSMDFEQVRTFIGSQINGYDPFAKDGRGIPSNSISAAYPWIFANVSDVGGIKFGESDGVPVFIDFFRRDSERINSNMVIIGKSGSGKSYATKSLLTNLAAEDSKIFILDPENEYTELAHNLHGKFINVGNAQYGRLNPFHIMTALEDDESDGTTVSGSYATHLQFLEEFFRQIMPEADKDAMEYLNSIIDRMYTNMGITGETDLSKLRPSDYPVFDDLYDAILQEFQKTENEYIRTMLRNLMNYISKFSTGGRNANIWNGQSTVTTDENFSVFNFQSLLANRNGSIANAQMLLVLKYIDNEIIKNRDYNTRNKTNRKIVVVIDEAHVFIDEKYPIALDFMFQLAKRIRKYNGMQIVITQNIKDFVGSEELARKSTAIINACQYSFIFALAPNDMDDLCKLYEKAGGINEMEQEQIVTAPRGQAFVVMGPQSRSSFAIEVPENVVGMFSGKDFVSHYFSGEDGQLVWEDFLENSREIYLQNFESHMAYRRQLDAMHEVEEKSYINFEEFEEELPSVVMLDSYENATSALDDSISFEEDELDSFELLFTEETEPISEEPVATETLGISEPASVQAEAMAQFMQRFSYDAMAAELRNMMELEVQKTRKESMEIIEAARKEADEIRAKAFAEIESIKSIAFTGAATVVSAVSSMEESTSIEEDESIDSVDSELSSDFDFSSFFVLGDDTDEDEQEEESKPAENVSEDATDEELSTDSSDDFVFKYGDEDENDTNDSFSDFSFFKFGEDENDEQDASSDELSQPDLEEKQESFDIMAQLLEEAKGLEDISAIEKMEAQGEEVIDITMEDLTKYIINLAQYRNY